VLKFYFEMMTFSAITAPTGSRKLH